MLVVTASDKNPLRTNTFKKTFKVMHGSNSGLTILMKSLAALLFSRHREESKMKVAYRKGPKIVYIKFEKSYSSAKRLLNRSKYNDSHLPFEGG